MIQTSLRLSTMRTMAGSNSNLIQHLPLLKLITLQMLVGPVTGRGKFEYMGLLQCSTDLRSQTEIVS
jgi:hypothetical protein